MKSAFCWKIFFREITCKNIHHKIVIFCEIAIIPWNYSGKFTNSRFFSWNCFFFSWNQLTEAVKFMKLKNFLRTAVILEKSCSGKSTRIWASRSCKMKKRKITIFFVKSQNFTIFYLIVVNEVANYKRNVWGYQSVLHMAASLLKYWKVKKLREISVTRLAFLVKLPEILWKC